MKVLFLAEEIPVPADTGAKLRTYNLVREASLRHAITLVCPCSPQCSADAVEAAFEGRVKVKLLPMDIRTGKSGLALVLRVAKNMLSPYPIIVDGQRSASVAEKLIKIAADEHFDMFHCDSIYMSSPLLTGLPLPRVFDAHNVEVVIWERYLERESNSFLKAFWRRQVGKMRAYESKLPEWFDVAVAVSEGDRQVMKTQFNWRDVFVAVNGVDLDYYSPAPDVNSGKMVFIGSLDWRPNQDAVSYMISDILPGVRAIHPEARLRIIGRRPPQWMVRMCADNGVDLNQDVPDVRPYLYEADITVVPLRIGGGSRLKILESLAAGKAVVSTTIGAEGLCFPDPQPVVMADSADEFAKAAAGLLAAPNDRIRLSRAGRQAVEQVYGWSESALNLEQAWVKAVAVRHNMEEAGIA